MNQLKYLLAQKTNAHAHILIVSLVFNKCSESIIQPIDNTKWSSG